MKLRILLNVFGLSLLCAVAAQAQVTPTWEVRPNWDKPGTLVKTAIAIEVCPEPPMRRGKKTHGPLYKALRDFGGDYNRMAFWYPYPRMSVAALEPPTKEKTSWDFTHMDPLVLDFVEAAQGRPVMINVSTIPAWMFKSYEPSSYPVDPDEIVWNYSKGRELRDPTLKEVRDYFVRVVKWYTQGGFADENGKWHESGHRLKIDAWEVLNEPDAENRLSPELYTRLYDEIVGELKKVDPSMKFSALAIAHPHRRQEYFEYFLNPKNHKPGIPIDILAYHYYIKPELDESPETQQHTFFTQTDGFVNVVRSIEITRKRLSPHTETYINELGSVTADNYSAVHAPVPQWYWHLSGAAFVYGFLELAKLQIDRIAAAELINYPGQYPGASLTDWTTGEPNARYHAIKLVHDHIKPGDQMVEDVDTRAAYRRQQPFAAQGFVTPDGVRKILVINKRSRPLHLKIAGGNGAQINYVDMQMGDNTPATGELGSEDLRLNGYAVAIIYLPKG